MLAQLAVDADVQEVCLDNNVVSAAEEQSVLLEGRAVSSWVERAYEKVKDYATLVQQTKYDEPESLEVVLTSLNGLALVYEALQAGESGARNMSTMMLDERTGEQLHTTAAKILRGIQYVEVSLWYSHHRKELSEYELVFSDGSQTSKCRWKDRAQWEASLGERRQLCCGAGLFLDDMVDTLRECEVECREGSWPTYPPTQISIATMIEELYLKGSLEDRALQAKHAVLLYCLLDLGLNKESSLVKGLMQTLQLPKSFWFDCSVYFLLDSESKADVDAAADLLPLIANSETPAKVAQVLALRGRTDAALLVLRASGDNGENVVAKREATTGMIVRLQCGLLLEAFLYQRRYCASIEDKNERVAVQAELITILIKLCLEQRALLEPLTQLPFLANEEEVVLQNLMEAAKYVALPAFPYVSLLRLVLHVAGSSLLD